MLLILDEHFERTNRETIEIVSSQVTAVTVVVVVVVVVETKLVILAEKEFRTSFHRVLHYYSGCCLHYSSLEKLSID